AIGRIDAPVGPAWMVHRKIPARVIVAKFVVNFLTSVLAILAQLLTILDTVGAICRHLTTFACPHARRFTGDFSAAACRAAASPQAAATITDTSAATADRRATTTDSTAADGTTATNSAATAATTASTTAAAADQVAGQE